MGAARKRAELGPVKAAVWFMWLWQNCQQRDHVVFGMLWQWHEGDGETCGDTHESISWLKAAWHHREVCQQLGWVQIDTASTYPLFLFTHCLAGG